MIYGFDSSLTHFGYAVLAPEGWRAAGVFATTPDADAPTRTGDLARRCEFLAQQLQQLVARHGPPSAICCEALVLPWGRTGLVTVSTLGRVRGLVDALAAQHLVRAQEVSPMQLKKLVAGHARAPKQAVQAALCRAYPTLASLLHQLAPASVEHAADAAGAIVAVRGGL